jgi:hypothetical protein
MAPLADVVPKYIETVLIGAEGDPAGQRGADEFRQLLIARNDFEIWMV